jgi:hypothetical protein
MRSWTGSGKIASIALAVLMLWAGGGFAAGVSTSHPVSSHSPATASQPATASRVDCRAVATTAQNAFNQRMSWAQSLYAKTIGQIQNKQLKACLSGLLKPHFNFGLGLPSNIMQQLLNRACSFAGQAEQNAIGRLGVNVNAYSPLGGHVNFGASGPTPNSGYTPFRGGYSVSGAAAGTSIGTSSSTNWLNAR